MRLIDRLRALLPSQRRHPPLPSTVELEERVRRLQAQAYLQNRIDLLRPPAERKHSQ